MIQWDVNVHVWKYFRGSSYQNIDQKRAHLNQSGCSCNLYFHHRNPQSSKLQKVTQPSWNRNVASHPPVEFSMLPVYIGLSSWALFNDVNIRLFTFFILSCQATEVLSNAGRHGSDTHSILPRHLENKLWRPTVVSQSKVDIWLWHLGQDMLLLALSPPSIGGRTQTRVCKWDAAQRNGARLRRKARRS